MPQSPADRPPRDFNTMRVGLFVPPVTSTSFFPRWGWRPLDVLERLGVDVEFPPGQTCCGQPMANTGCTEDARPLAHKFFREFREFEHVVCPVRELHGDGTAPLRRVLGTALPKFDALRGRTFELVRISDRRAPNRRLAGTIPAPGGAASELSRTAGVAVGGLQRDRRRLPSARPAVCLESLDGIEFAELKRPDECCGFGGKFAVGQEAVSCMMGPRPARRPSTSRDRGADRCRYVLSHAPGRTDPQARTEYPRDAHRRDPRRLHNGGSTDSTCQRRTITDRK